MEANTGDVEVHTEMVKARPGVAQDYTVAILALPEVDFFCKNTLLRINLLTSTSMLIIMIFFQ
jgi:hypothetical protein